MSDDYGHRVDVYHDLRRDLDSFFSGDRIEAFLKGLAAGCQLVEDDIYELYVGTSLNDSTGEALRQWGQLVGEERRELTETQYRRIIAAKIRALDGEGTASDLVDVYRTSVDAFDILRVGAYPAGVSLTAVVDSMPGAYYSGRIRRLVESSKPEGVQLALKVALPDFFQSGDSFENTTSARVL